MNKIFFGFASLSSSFLSVGPSTVLRDDKGRFTHGYFNPHYNDLAKRTRCKFCKSEIKGWEGLRCKRGTFCDGCCFVRFVLKDWLEKRGIK